MPYILFTVCLLLYVYPFMRLLHCPGDEGTFAYGAVRVTEGQVPLRDFFEVNGPGVFYWLALFFKMFGATVSTTRVSLAFTTILIALVTYFLTRRLNTRYASLPAALVLATGFGPAWPAISHHHDSNLFALLAFAALLHWLDTGRPASLVVSGVLAGVTTCFLQPKGVFLFLSFLVLICLLPGRAPRLRSILWLTGAYLAVGFVVTLFYWRVGGLTGLLYANVVFPLKQYGEVNSVPYAYCIKNWYWSHWVSGLDAVAPHGVSVAIASALVIPFLFVAAVPGVCGAIGMSYRRVAFNSTVLPYWMSGAAIWLSEIHRRDITHLVHGSTLLIILCFYFLAQQRNQFFVHSFQIICICVFSLALFNWFTVLAAAGNKIVTRRGTYYAASPDPIIDFLDAHVAPQQEIFVYPYSPMYYFLTATRNPTPFSILMYGINTDAQFHDAVEYLDKSRVRYVVWDHDFEKDVKEAFPAYEAPPEGQLIMEPYLTRHYHLVQHVQGIDILERDQNPIENSFKRRDALAICDVSITR
ncbi:MAG: hypothetical protein JOY54_04270 [Acidobacteriaceae bacterium]|nr:hypothetical protein [Acidobacteriaceae bacterium]